MDASAADLESAMKYSPIGMAVVAPTGVWLAVNPALCELVGYTREELLGGDFQSITHPEDLAADLAHVQRALSGMVERFTMEKRYLRKDGRVVWVELHASLVSNADGTPKHFISQIVDITERRRVAQAQIESRAKLMLALHGGRIATWEYDVVHDRFAYDEQVPRIFHSTRDARRFTLADYIQEFVVPEHGAVVANAVREALGSLSDAFTAHFEHEVIRHDGRRGVHLVWFSVIRSGGRVVKLVGATQDVTERRHAEQRLRESEERLRQAQKMEAVGQLAGGVAHDFNNLLSAILMQVEEASSYPGLEPGLLASICDIGAAAERAVRLTRQLLMFSRKQPMQIRQVDLNDVVSGFLPLLRRMLPENIDTRFRPGVRPALTIGDASMLEQVVMNLAVNARDAMPTGGRIDIEIAHRDLSEDEARAVPDATPGRCVALRVSDDGCGIPPEALPRIFEPFFTTKDAGRGTGLGLATVFGIVKQHHGWITVSSLVGRGTTFDIVLPASPELAAPRGQTLPPELPCGGHETILLVEDDASLRRLTGALLGRHGYQVLEAESGVAALALWNGATQRIDLLLTDMVMPDGVSGRDLANQLQARAPALKVLLTSGHGADIATLPRETGPGRRFLAKPCTPRRLLEAVRSCLDE